jgi:beta-glucosidase
MRMVKLLVVAAVVLLAVSAALGQSGDFQTKGKVVISGGQALAMATISYTSISKRLSWDFSTADGSFGAKGTPVIQGAPAAAHFSLPSGGLVSIDIFDVTGKKVFSAADRNLDKGTYTLDPIMAKLPKAMYVVRLKTANAISYQKLINSGSGERVLPAFAHSSQNSPVEFAKILAILDTVRVGKTGYAPKYIAINSYAADIGTVTLTPIDIEGQVTTLLAKMSDDDKIRQFIMTDISQTYTAANGFLFAGGGECKTYSGATLADYCDSKAVAGVGTANKIPIMIGYDGVHGASALPQTTLFPHNMGMGSIQDTALIQKAFRVAACEIRGGGITMTFAPCIAVIRDDRWGRAYEGFSESTDLTKVMARQAVLGLQTSDLSLPWTVAACCKHFAGDGGTANGQNEGTTQGPEATARAIHLPAYEEAVKVGVASIMPSFSTWCDGISMHGNKALLTDWLKTSIGFDGVVVGDWQAHYRAGNSPIAGNPSANAIIAGLDVPMAAEPVASTVTNMNALKASYMTRVNDDVKRVLRLKYRMNLFSSYLTDRRLTTVIGSTPHRDVARECVRKSLVLLKNDGKVLPMPKTGKKIAVWGTPANNLGIQCGDWSVLWNGGAAGEVPYLSGTTILQGFKNVSSAVADADYTANGLASAAAYDYVVAFLGEMPYAETWFADISITADISKDRGDVTCTSNQSVINNIKTAKAAGKKVIVVLIAGRPLDISGVLPYCDAFVWASLPGTEGQGIPQVLFNDQGYGFSGKLPFTWPTNNAQEPINAGDGKVGLFAFGAGMTY